MMGWNVEPEYAFQDVIQIWLNSLLCWPQINASGVVNQIGKETGHLIWTKLYHLKLWGQCRRVFYTTVLWCFDKGKKHHTGHLND